MYQTPFWALSVNKLFVWQWPCADATVPYQAIHFLSVTGRALILCDCRWLSLGTHGKLYPTQTKAITLIPFLRMIGFSPKWDRYTTVSL